MIEYTQCIQNKVCQNKTEKHNWQRLGFLAGFLSNCQLSITKRTFIANGYTVETLDNQI